MASGQLERDLAELAALAGGHRHGFDDAGLESGELDPELEGAGR